MVTACLITLQEKVFFGDVFLSYVDRLCFVFVSCGWEILSRVQTLSVLSHLPLLPGAGFFPLSCDEPFQFSTPVISQCSIYNIQTAVLLIMVGAVLRKSRPCVSLSHSVLLPLYVLLSLRPTPFVYWSHSLCIPVLLCPTLYTSHTVPHSLCILVPLCPTLYASPVVNPSLCIPVPLCSTPFVYQSHYVPLPLYTGPIVSHRCILAPLCPTPFVYWPHCVPLPLYTGPIVSHSLCILVPLCPTPFVYWSHCVLLPLYISSTMSHSICILVPLCPTPFVSQFHYVPVPFPCDWNRSQKAHLSS